MMSKDFIPIKKAYAGNIIAIVGVSKYISRTGTLSSSLLCNPLTQLPYQVRNKNYQQVAPIISVSIEPADINDLVTLKDGLKMLNLSDPCLEVEFEVIFLIKHRKRVNLY